MNEHVRTPVQREALPLFTPVRGLLQRSGLNAGPTGIPTIVNEVLRSPGQSLDPATGAFMGSRFGHDFSSVQTHSDHRVVSPAHLLTISAGVAANLWTGHSEVFVNGPGGGTTPTSSSPALAPSPLSPPTSAVTNCPTDIKVAGVGQGNDSDFGRKGPITGWGGFALMEVSDPSSKTWDGTEIHETLRNIRNTCGDEGNNACSNRTGEGQGTGSTFKVGAESNFLGLAPLPAARNRFYDLHVFAKKGSSLLHLINKPSCEIQCEQFYDCSGTRFGSEFVITYSMNRDAVTRVGGGWNGVTRVEVSKVAKSTPAPSPTALSASQS